MANKRKPIQAATLQAVAAQYTGQPIDEARARSYLAYMEPICEMLSGLRNLPLKDIEPAITFSPIVSEKTDE